MNIKKESLFKKNIYFIEILMIRYGFPPHDDIIHLEPISDKEKSKRLNEIWKQSSENNNVHENYDERIKYEHNRVRRITNNDIARDRATYLGINYQHMILHELVSIRAVLEKIESKLDKEK